MNTGRYLNGVADEVAILQSDREEVLLRTEDNVLDLCAELLSHEALVIIHLGECVFQFFFNIAQGR
jgi:hypothetical protein